MCTSDPSELLVSNERKLLYTLTRPWEVIDFEELLSELIARARMLHLHLGPRLVSTSMTYGVRCHAFIDRRMRTDCLPSEINLHINHSQLQGAQNYRSLNSYYMSNQIPEIVG